MKHDKPSEDDVPQRDQEKLFDLPELLHNLDLLVDMAGEEIIGNNNKYVHFAAFCTVASSHFIYTRLEWR